MKLTEAYARLVRPWHAAVPRGRRYNGVNGGYLAARAFVGGPLYLSYLVLWYGAYLYWAAGVTMAFVLISPVVLASRGFRSRRLRRAVRWVRA